MKPRLSTRAAVEEQLEPYDHEQELRADIEWCLVRCERAYGCDPTCDCYWFAQYDLKLAHRRLQFFLFRRRAVR